VIRAGALFLQKHAGNQEWLKARATDGGSVEGILSAVLGLIGGAIFMGAAAFAVKLLDQLLELLFGF